MGRDLQLEKMYRQKSEPAQAVPILHRCGNVIKLSKFGPFVLISVLFCNQCQANLYPFLNFIFLFYSG